jgi:hypothetical protein
MVLFVAPVFLYIFMRLTGLATRDLIAAVAPSIASSAGILGTVALFGHFGLGWRGKPLFLLTQEIILGGITGLTILLALDKTLHSAAVRLIKRTGLREYADKAAA